MNFSFDFLPAELVQKEKARNQFCQAINVQPEIYLTKYDPFYLDLKWAIQVPDRY